MMRFRSMTAMAVMAVLVAGSLAFAQGTAQGTGQGTERGRRGPGGGLGGPGGRGLGGPAGVELRGLDLNQTQREQIQEIATRYREQMRNEIMLVLTPDQQVKARQLEAQREARLKQRLEQLQQRRQQSNP